MTKIVFILLLSLSFLQLRAQEEKYKEMEPQELEKLLNSKNLEESSYASYYLGIKVDQNDLDRKKELYLKSAKGFKTLKDEKMYYNAQSRIVAIYVAINDLLSAESLIEKETTSMKSQPSKEGIARMWDRYVEYIAKKGVKKDYEVALIKMKKFVESFPTDYGWYLYWKRFGTSAYMFGDMAVASEGFEKSVPFIAKDDKEEKAGMLMNIGIINYRNGKLDIALKTFKSSAKVFEEAKDHLNAGHAYLNVVSVFFDKGQHDSLSLAVDVAMNYYQKAGDTNAMFMALEYKALAAHNEQKLDIALKYHMEVLEHRLKVNDESGLYKSYMNIADVYETMKDYEMQLDFLKKSGAIALKREDPRATANFYSNMAMYFYNNKVPDSSLFYAEKNLEISRAQKNPRMILGALLTMGNTYKTGFGDLDKALKYYLESYAIAEELKLDSQIAGLGHNIGVIYEEKGDYRKAIKYIEASYAIRKNMDNKDYLMDSYITLSNVYGKLGDFKKAHEALNNYVALKDSLFSDKMTNSIAEMRTIYETKQIEDSLHISKQSEENAHLAKEKLSAENDRKAVQIYGLIGVLVLAGIAIFIAIRSSQQRKRANITLQNKNSEITLQKEIIEEKNNEIMDSISYAKRIQSAILPPDKLVKSHLPNSFILYKPKDVVAGDFYWMEVNKSLKQDKILIAAADCTGHGVPGAMVSVVCNNGLNRSVREFGLTDPGKILDKTRELVIQEFEKSEEEVKDGMDIALVSLSLSDQGDGVQSSNSHALSYAGANNPLWIVRNNSDEVEEYRANKQPIGKFDQPEPFKTHELQLNQGDTVYFFSDGFADQFGGDKGKKFKSSNFKKFILKIRSLNMENQKMELDRMFEKWRGDNEQIDDVCVIGIRV